MLIGFQRRFAAYVEEGSKTCTIRAKRKRPPRVGEICHCYVDTRQKTMRLLGRWPCIAVQDVRIEDGQLLLDGMLLDPDESNFLAWKDGFRPEHSTESAPGRSFESMLDFFGPRLPFRGTLIRWDYAISFADSRRSDSSGRQPGSGSNAPRRSTKAPQSLPAEPR